jgi:hypothetical protein
MITAFNDELFKLDENLLDLGLQVFCPIEVRNTLFDKLFSVSVATSSGRSNQSPAQLHQAIVN